ncbi:MAG: hypothetical protein IT561_20540 [Alphaproteobacteria bacterium]|nr:hypothetical protein [Alphaproteobacteria bacterium]
MAAGGRARLAWTVAAMAMAAKPQTVPAMRPVRTMTSASSPKRRGSAIATRITIQAAVPTRNPTPKKVTEETVRSA